MKAMCFQHFSGFISALCGIEFQPHSAVGKLTVVGDADILDVDVFLCEKISNFGDGAGMIGDVNMQYKFLHDRTAVNIAEAVAVFSCGIEKLIDRIFIRGSNFIAVRLKIRYVTVQELYDIVFVREADMLPHRGGGRGDSCNILESSGSNHLHDSVIRITFPYKIHKCRRNHVRHMRYGTGDVIVKVIVENKRNRMKRLNQFSECFYFFFRNFLLRSENIICVLEERSLGIAVFRALASGHRMSSDEVRRKAQADNRIVNTGFYGTDVCNDGIIGHMGFYSRKIVCVAANRSAEEDIMTLLESIIDPVCRFAEYAVGQCFIQGISARVIGKNIGLRIILADCPRDGASDEAKTYESVSVFCSRHIPSDKAFKTLLLPVISFSRTCIHKYGCSRGSEKTDLRNSTCLMSVFLPSFHINME